MKQVGVVGVDGCRAGWFAIAFDAKGNAGFRVFKTISELWSAFTDTGFILIDIPIGLPSKQFPVRKCDQQARKVLSPLRHNSVFPAPCREALSASTYQEACSINFEICGKKISQQTWNIAGKIKQVDDLLRRRPITRHVIRETHPEICFSLPH